MLELQTGCNYCVERLHAFATRVSPTCARVVRSIDEVKVAVCSQGHGGDTAVHVVPVHALNNQHLVVNCGQWTQVARPFRFVLTA